MLHKKRKENHIERILEIKNLRIQTGSTEPSITSKIQELEERMSDIEGEIKKCIHGSKKMLSLKNFDKKYRRNMEYCGKPKSMKSRNRGKRRLPVSSRLSSNLCLSLEHLHHYVLPDSFPLSATPHVHPLNVPSRHS